MKRKDKKITLYLVVLIIAAAAAIALIRGVSSALRTSDFFKVKEFNIADDSAMDLSHLLERNIFTIDLKKEARSLRARHPEFMISGVSRVLPDKISVDFKRRIAVAQIKSYRFLFIDEEGVILPKESDYGNKMLPLIVGLRSKIKRPKYGWSYGDLREIKLALRLIEELKKNAYTSSLIIGEIDVSSLKDLSFSIRPYGLKIRIGHEDISRRLRLLAVLLKQLDVNPGDLSYIDLRFSEPVVKPR